MFGDVLAKRGTLDEALAVYRESLAIRRALADRDKTNVLWQTDVSVNQMKIGEYCCFSYPGHKAAPVLIHNPLVLLLMRRFLVLLLLVSAGNACKRGASTERVPDAAPDAGLTRCSPSGTRPTRPAAASA